MRFELTTSDLEGRHSSQLSYTRFLCTQSRIRTYKNLFLKQARIPFRHLGIIAVRDGFEPPRGDSTNNISPAGWWSTPSYYLSISVSPPPRQEGLSANFNTLQKAESIGFEPMHPFRDDRLAICSFNHSGNSLLLSYKDSNLDQENQNLLCYRYTIG